MLDRVNLTPSVRIITPGAAGITAGTGTIFYGRSIDYGSWFHTVIDIDLTGLNSSAAADIIGVDAAADCHLGQITAAANGTIDYGFMRCLEAPLTGEPDIDLYSATESTGTEDTAITALTETALLLAAADWTLDMEKPLTAFPAADEYLYLVGSGGGTDATYTAGRFRIEMFGS